MQIAEDFERCDNCGGGWFRIETHTLIKKGSPTDDPVHEAKEDHYICIQCAHTQYTKDLM